MAIRKQYRSMQGKVVDLDQLVARNELVPAIGNIPVNARGDELGPGGTIIRKREDIVSEYYERNTNFTPIENTVRKIAEVPAPQQIVNVDPIPAPMPKTVITKAVKNEQPTE
jgi:hypothetical protein